MSAQVAYNYQPSLFANKSLTAKFPSTRYQGSKAKLADWIWEEIKSLDFTSCLDAFGGTGSIAYRFKQAGKCVTYNDILRFNYHFGRALVENRDVRLTSHEISWLLQQHADIEYPTLIQDNFPDIYFTAEENAWLDQTITNIRQLENPYKFALAFFALAQAAIVKRPYNLFHRKNLYLRLADVERSFGNKTSWDRPFPSWFQEIIAEANQAVFDNGQANHALNMDALDIPNEYDLVYIDTPYISARGAGVDYRDFYHFLEGLTNYKQWETQIDHQSKHRRLKRQPCIWTNREQIYAAFERLFAHYQESILVVSYRSDGIPTAEELRGLLRKYKSQVRVVQSGRYKYALSDQQNSEELLFIGDGR
ncbi:MAG: DNA adenine methylase [Anaerolineae bacterium]|nr:DNA adenine methylase [Anaerolineae bacterium]